MWRTPLTCHFSEVLQWSLWTRSIDQTGTRNVLYSQEQISRSVIILAILGSYWATFYYQGSCHIYSSYSRNFSDSNHFKLQREFRPSNEIFLQNWPRYLKVGTHGVGELSFFHNWFVFFILLEGIVSRSVRNRYMEAIKLWVEQVPRICPILWYDFFIVPTLFFPGRSLLCITENSPLEFFKPYCTRKHFNRKAQQQRKTLYFLLK